MLAYRRVLQVRRGLLITIGQSPRRTYHVRDDQTQIDVLAVNFNGTITDVNASVERLVKFIREQIA